MTVPEWASLMTGFALLSYFCIVSALPYAMKRVESIADRRSEQLKRDFLWWSARGLVAGFLATGIALGIATWRMVGNLPLALGSIAIPAMLSGLAVRHYKRVRLRKVTSQLPGFLDTLSGYIKAGHSLPEALAGSESLLPRGIREDVSWIVRMNRLGTPLSETFMAWEAKSPSPEMTLVARPLRISLSTGGNVVSLLERTRDVLRARQRQADKMKSMTAQARLQAIVLTLMPPLFLLVLSRMQEGFLEAMTGTPIGRLILVCAGILQLFGWLLIRKILGVKT
jgi:tight adherence protein B